MSNFVGVAFDFSVMVIDITLTLGSFLTVIWH